MFSLLFEGLLSRQYLKYFNMRKITDKTPHLFDRKKGKRVNGGCLHGSYLEVK